MASSTPSERTTTPGLKSLESSKGPTFANATGFETCGDSVLGGMLCQSGKFWGEVRAGSPPRWLSLCGGTGTGKTFLARKLVQFAQSLARLHCQGDIGLGPRNRSYAARFFSWPEITEGFVAGRYAIVDEMKGEWFVVIDDIGATREKMSDLDVDKLFKILNERRGMWTVLTSNQSLREIAGQEARIADRMIRKPNVVVNCDTKSFSLR